MAVVSEDRTQTYGQYCPVSRALELLGERWALLIVRDLLCGTTRFNDLARGLPGLSRTCWQNDCASWPGPGSWTIWPGEYVLTPAGRELEPIVFGLGGWGRAVGVQRPHPGGTRPATVGVVDARSDRHVRDSGGEPARDCGDLHRRGAVVLDCDRPGGTASVCESDPGYPVDLTVRGGR